MEGAVELYRQCFGRWPRGIWPAEGAVSQSVLPFFARSGVRWIASDEGVLARSGLWGYRSDLPEVLCRPYRAEESDHHVSIFFRDRDLSDSVGFRYGAYSDYELAARELVEEIRIRFSRRLSPQENPVLTIVLDGENAWGGYRDDGRPFLRSLYRRLGEDPEIQTTTFSEYLEGSAARGVDPHPLEVQIKVYDLFTGSWIDENGSAPGVDLGTWIGEEQENRAWDLLHAARVAVGSSAWTPATAPDLFRALHAAEGSDWFWWFGDDQASGNDSTFDDLFRGHLPSIYRLLRVEPPADLEQHIVPHSVTWTFSGPVGAIQPTDLLVVRTNCPGGLAWRLADGETKTTTLAAVGGVMAGLRRHQVVLGPFPSEARGIHFRFYCAHPGCDGKGACCAGEEHLVRIAADPRASSERGGPKRRTDTQANEEKGDPR